MHNQKYDFNKILERYIQGLYTQKDVNRLFDAVKSDPEISHLEGEMDRIWAGYTDKESDQIRHRQYKEEARKLLKRLDRPRFPQRISIYPFLKYTAILAILLSLGIGVYYATTSQASTEVVYSQVHVSNGELEELILPDGTSVILNAGSTIRYPIHFTLNERSVELDGEAFFNVKRNEDMPFVVQTKHADIRVLGTSFNLKAYQEDEQLMVSVQSGKIQVDMPESMTRLTANEQLILDKNTGDFQKKKEDIKRVKSWIHGGLYFNRTPIRSVVFELKRIYDCDIVLDNRFDYDEYIYGEHDNKSLESVLKSIQYSTDIRFRKEGDKYVLYKSQ